MVPLFLLGVLAVAGVILGLLARLEFEGLAALCLINTIEFSSYLRLVLLLFFVVFISIFSVVY